ncbi:AsnC family transcriptional regulator [Candidatus Bathyarchaeota archaeon B24-2]|nr:MAG: AsnC family transcriptional regulator [Candidatus Bathyarchaeota archaeon B24-2]
MVSACILIRTRHGEYGKVVERLKALEGVTRVFPVLGRYDVVVDFEAPDMAKLGKSVLKISRMAGVVFTETLIGIEEGEERC